jgi:hypothetical protein
MVGVSKHPTLLQKTVTFRKQVEKIDYFGKELRIYPTSDYLRADQSTEPQVEVETEVLP